MSARMQNFPNPELSMPQRLRNDKAFRELPVLFALCLAFCAFSAANAQMTTQNGRRVPQQTPQIGVPTTIGPNGNGTFQERRIRQMNVERQKEMVSETNDLLKLTAQLNAEVAKNHSTSLTPDQMRTLARIEKLAKSVREKMSNPVQGTIFEDNFPPPMAPPTMP